MNDMMPNRYRFEPYDRITISGVHYKWTEKKKDVHLLLRMIGNVAEPGLIPLSDAEYQVQVDRRNVRVEKGYYSKVRNELRIRNGDSSLLTLTEEELKTIAWKVRWCERFEEALKDPDYPVPINFGKDNLKTFIRLEAKGIDSWYRRKYRERRQVGRPVLPDSNPEPGTLVVKERKEFDYPSHSALHGWVTALRGACGNPEIFMPRYKECGNRKQLAPELDEILTKVVDSFKDLRRFESKMVFQRLEAKLLEVNAGRKDLKPYAVSDTTVYNRIKKLNPFEVEAARHGPRRATKRYAMVGVGNGATAPLERVEMDDWEVDLYALAEKSSIWKKFSKEQRAKFPRVRFTITAAIDCATRCIVGFHVSPYAPSTPAVRATIATIFDDKQRYIDFFKIPGDGLEACTWPMAGRPEMISTDGGKVFDNEEIDYTLEQCGINKDIPEQDERKRGTIEAFFRTLKRLCRNFAGQSFANVLQRGDYPGPEMASMTYEEFLHSVVVFIAKVYHHSPRRGLEDFTPFSRWKKLVQEHDMDPVPDTAQRIVAFGFRHAVDVTLDKHGLLYLGLSYTSRETKALGMLMRQVGHGAKLAIIVNPNDLGSILVHVAEDAHRQAIAGEAKGALIGEFLEIDTDPAYRGVSLAQHLMTKAEVRAMAKAEQAKGNAFRISGNAFLFEQGDKAIEFLKLNHHGLTQAEAEQLANQIDWLSSAGQGRSPHGQTQSDGTPATFGQPGATPKKTRATKARNGEGAAKPKQNSTKAAPNAGQAKTNASASKPVIGFSRSANQVPYKK